MAALKYVLSFRNMYLHSEICIDTPKYVLTLRNTLSRRHAYVRKPSLCSKIWAPPHERVHNVLLPSSYLGSHHVPPPVPTRRKVLSMPKTFAGSRRSLTGHQRVHRLLNAPPCALAVFHRPHEIYHTVAHGRLSQHHVTAT